jgi:hypothetical protein
MKRVISYTGSHGTGKSTDASRTYYELKKSNPTASVRLFCDLEADCPFPINVNTTEEAQLWMFSNQIQVELFALSRFDILVTDRTIIDVIAYTYCAGFQGLTEAMLAVAEQYVGHYSEITFKQIKDNPYCFPDGIRDDDVGFRVNVENTLIEIYKMLDLEGFIKGPIYYV